MTDIPGNTLTRSTVTVGGSTTSSLEVKGDHDWFAITLQAGQQIVINVSGSGASPLIDPYLYLRNSFGAKIAENDDSGGTRDSQLTFTAPSSGTYYIDVGAWNEDYTGTYQVSVQPYSPPPEFTYDQMAGQLTHGYWNGDWHRFDVGPGGSITVSLSGLTTAGQTLARSALAAWTDIIGISFTEVFGAAQITFDDNESGAFAESVWSSNVLSSSHVNISTQWLSTYGTGINTYSHQTYLHEIGHALGLGHAGDYNGSAQYPADATYINDSWATSVMSYFSQAESSYFAERGFTEQFVLTPMNADVVAIQALYGASTTTRTGDTVYGFNSNAGNPVYNATQFPGVAYTIVDSGGNDTLDYSGYAVGQAINLAAETFSNVGGRIGNVVIARGSVIENAIGGSGNDTITGNGADNVLIGGAGNDSLDGGLGADLLYGGAGADTITGGAGADQFYFNSALGSGADQISDLEAGDVIQLDNNVFTALASGALPSTAFVQGSAATTADHRIIYNSATGQISYDPDGTGAAAATLFATVAPGTGLTAAAFAVYGASTPPPPPPPPPPSTTTVESSVSYTLASGEVNLLLTGTAAINGTGNSLDNQITGNSAANLLSGLGGNDTLDGGAGNDTLNGGAGSDTMTGGLGNDIYVVDNSGDVVNEAANAGTDTVNASITYVLGANLERLQLSGNSAINGTGNALANQVTGNGGANMLYGLGGNDILTGAAGNDVLYGDDGADSLQGGLGVDQLYGGTGADRFIFRNGDSAGSAAAADRIMDFTRAQGDRIVLNGIDANSAMAGDQAFTFIAANAFGGTAGQLRYQQVGADTYLQGDTNGDGVADFQIAVTGLHAFVSTDFIL